MILNLTYNRELHSLSLSNICIVGNSFPFTEVDSFIFLHFYHSKDKGMNVFKSVLFKAMNVIQVLFFKVILRGTEIPMSQVPFRLAQMILNYFMLLFLQSSFSFHLWEVPNASDRI